MGLDTGPQVGPLGAEEVAFVLCVESNRLAAQARLLCESLRTFGGRYRDASVVAISPRPHRAIESATRAALEALGVLCIVEPLNPTGSPYGTINRIVAGAWAEAVRAEPYLVVLDTDTVFVGEPELARADAGVRPVDVKGSASAGPDDPMDAYWARVCAVAEIEPSRLPWLSTTIDRRLIRASYNGGFTVVRRELGILRKTEEIFLATFAEDLRPRRGEGINVLASTGLVGLDASEWWGASQAALSVAIWATTSEVRLYDDRYNVPLNNLTDPGQSWPTAPGFEPILLHYHHLAEPPFRPALRPVLDRIGCPSPVGDWIEHRLPYFEA